MRFCRARRGRERTAKTPKSPRIGAELTPNGWLFAPNTGRFTPNGSRRSQRVRVEKTSEERLSVFATAIVEKLVDEALTASAAVRKDVLQLDETREVHVHLAVAPAAAL